MVHFLSVKGFDKDDTLIAVLHTESGDKNAKKSSTLDSDVSPAG